MSHRIKSLYVSYNGVLEPLFQSQGIPYLDGLTEKGVEFTLLSFEKVKPDSEEKRKIREMKERLASMGIDWHWLRYHKKPLLLAKLFDISHGIIYSFWLAITKKIQIIHARSTMPGAITLPLKLILKKKLIFDMRGLNAEEYVDAGSWSKYSLRYKIMNKLEKKLIYLADGIVVLTDTCLDFIREKNYLSPNSNSNVKVIPCCVNLKRFSSNPKENHNLKKELKLEGKFVLTYVGSLGTWYMLNEMVDFFSVLKDKTKNGHFLILTHSDKNLIKKAIEDKAQDTRNFTIMKVPYQDMPSYISIADAGIFFIKQTFSKRFSCPTKYAEYLASGLPMIINAGIGDTDKFVKTYNIGVVVERFEKEEYVKAINKLFEIVKSRDSLANRCRKVAEDFFSLEKGVEKYSQIYMRITS